MKIMERIKLKVEKIVSTDLNKSNVGSDNLASYGLQDITLRPYQLDGVQWLVERYYRKHGCILADEMGLGKTCQTISMLVFLQGSGESLGPHLVLSPLSVINNWKNELSKFAPGLKTLVYTGTKEERPALQKKMRAESDYNVVITTYEMCLKDESFFRKFSWHVLIVDEAHRLKNRQSLLHQVLREFDVNHTVLLTGTPVQNNLKELYALLSFVAPSIFRDRYLEDFVDEYSEDLTAANNSSNDMSSLHDLLKPFLLRRIKSEVVKDLPKKSEVILYHGLSTVQKTYYKAILIKDTEAFENPNKTVKTRMMNILMQLRKCVNHPYLFDGVEPEPFQLGEHLVEASGKLLLLDQLLSYLQVKGHKVLLFSQMTRMLDIVQDYLGYRGFSYERLDGSVRGEERYLAIQNFNEDDDTFIFLLSTKAGGVGLNLVAADTVIFLDSDFNPQNDLQAAARAHRIGQTRAVKVIRLVGRSTVEEIVFKRALMKLKLTNTVIEGGQFSSVTEKTDLIADDNFQMQDILKFGVDKLFETEDATLEDVDFDGMLGQTVSGEWQPEGATATPATASQTQIEVQSLEEDMNTDEPSPSMYMFEGTDYSKGTSRADQKAFNQLISVAKAEEEESFDDGRALRKHNSNLLGLLPDTSGLKKPRKQLTPEEIEARNQKRIETIARRAKQAEENKRKKREALWKANNYTSVNIELDSEGEESEEEGVEPVIGQSGDEDSEGKRQDLGYVVGDVTKPQNTTGGAIIVHCVDDSGRWGSGGLFSALGRCSARPEEQYELAGRMGDLSLGDVHLLPLYDKQNRDDGMDYCALIVAQHRDKKNNLSGIKMSALNTALIKIHKEAKKMNASVHLPRIGHNTPGFNWYGTERLLRKHLAAKGIPTYIYYYPRKHKKKRIASTDDNDSENEERSTHKAKRANTSNHSQTSGPNSASRSPSPQPSTSHEKQPHRSDSSGATVFKKQHSSNNSKSKLSDFLGGVSVNFHKLSQEVVDGYKRRVVACDGDTDEFVSATTSHIVVDPDLGEDQQDDLLSILSDYPQVIVLTTTWLDDCFTQGKQLPTADYLYG